jgi:hypothetical protein
VIKIEDPIRYLSDHTDYVTKQMLTDVVARKQKFDMVERKLLFWRVMTISMISLFFIYIWAFIIKGNNYSFAVSISEILGNVIHLYILLLAGMGIGFINFYDKKKDKAEKEYHDLRCEIIKKSIELWPLPDKWIYRQEVFEMMKQEFDINLYHESK